MLVELSAFKTHEKLSGDVNKQYDSTLRTVKCTLLNHTGEYFCLKVSIYSLDQPFWHCYEILTRWTIEFDKINDPTMINQSSSIILLQFIIYISVQIGPMWYKLLRDILKAYFEFVSDLDLCLKLCGGCGHSVFRFHRSFW